MLDHDLKNYERIEKERQNERKKQHKQRIITYITTIIAIFVIEQNVLLNNQENPLLNNLPLIVMGIQFGICIFIWQEWCMLKRPINEKKTIQVLNYTHYTVTKNQKQEYVHVYIDQIEIAEVKRKNVTFLQHDSEERNIIQIKEHINGVEMITHLYINLPKNEPLL